MIKTFKHKVLKKFYLTGSTVGIQSEHESKIEMILSVLDNADSIQDLNFPAFRLHKLSGNRFDIWLVWVNRDWRITFRSIDGNVEIVNYEGYH
jgi:proteic killer suppression protein